MTVAYPLAQVRSEVAYIAYHFHWDIQTILDLPHRERVEWVGQISALNKKILESMEP